MNMLRLVDLKSRFTQSFMTEQEREKPYWGEIKTRNILFFIHISYFILIISSHIHSYSFCLSNNLVQQPNLVNSERQ